MNDTLANTEKKTAYILTLPAVLLVFSIILFPIFANIWISFKEVELKNHPWFIGVQFHPEFKSSPLTPHPLFSSFIKAAKNHKK